MIQFTNDDAASRGVFSEEATDYEAYAWRAARLIEKATELLTDACSMRASVGEEVVISARSADTLLEASQDLGDVIRRITED